MPTDRVSSLIRYILHFGTRMMLKLEHNRTRANVFAICAALIVGSHAQCAWAGSAETLLDAVSAYKRGDYSDALAWYKAAAERGDPAAQTTLGDFYGNGLGVAQDYDQALRWYKRAGKNGYAAAQLKIGDFYKAGRGVDPDYEEAVGWYKKAGEQGYSAAQQRLGDAFKEGLGVTTDYAVAADWYKKAGEQNNPAPNWRSEAYICKVWVWRATRPLP